MFNIFKKKEDPKIQAYRSMAMFDAGLINKKDICIKDFGTTFACVCDKCQNEAQIKLDKLLN